MNNHMEVKHSDKTRSNTDITGKTTTTVTEKPQVHPSWARDLAALALPPLLCLYLDDRTCSALDLHIAFFGALIRLRIQWKPSNGFFITPLGFALLVLIAFFLSLLEKLNSTIHPHLLYPAFVSPWMPSEPIDEIENTEKRFEYELMVFKTAVQYILMFLTYKLGSTLHHTMLATPL